MKFNTHNIELIKSGDGESEVEEGLRKKLIEKIATDFAEVATVCTTTTCNGGSEAELAQTTVAPRSDAPQTQGDKPGKDFVRASRRLDEPGASRQRVSNVGNSNLGHEESMDIVVVRTHLSDCLDGTRCDEETVCREAQLRCIGEQEVAQNGPERRKKISECMVRNSFNL